MLWIADVELVIRVWYTNYNVIPIIIFMVDCLFALHHNTYIGRLL